MKERRADTRGFKYLVAYIVAKQLPVCFPWTYFESQRDEYGLTLPGYEFSVIDKIETMG